MKNIFRDRHQKENVESAAGRNKIVARYSVIISELLNQIRLFLSKTVPGSVGSNDSAKDGKKSKDTNDDTVVWSPNEPKHSIKYNSDDTIIWTPDECETQNRR